MTSNNKRNKRGKGPSQDSILNSGRTPGPSREHSAPSSATSSPVPGSQNTTAGVSMGSGQGGQYQTGFNGTVPKHIYDFSKALAGEVRVLLAEVGQLREERRQLQYEIAEIMALKSKHAASQGEYGGIPGGMNFDHPDALTYAMSGLALSPPPGHFPQDSNLALAPADLSVPSEPSGPAPPAWRTVHKRADRKARAKKGSAPQAIPSPSQVPPLEVPKPNVPAWAQWRPNPLLSPNLQQGPFPGIAATPPPIAGLFGPPSPPPK
ncbi:hypothetical protein EV360DRAFT_71414 [Lentinula raphanica]|nr:hypothetical protein EV360DRAFT_71414 [Lentinula raphanica]